MNHRESVHHVDEPHSPPMSDTMPSAVAVGTANRIPLRTKTLTSTYAYLRKWSA
jgi:hypothetical protein